MMDRSISRLNHGKEPFTISFVKYSKMKNMLMIKAPITDTRKAVAFGDDAATSIIIRATRLDIYNNIKN